MGCRGPHGQGKAAAVGRRASEGITRAQMVGIYNCRFIAWTSTYLPRSKHDISSGTDGVRQGRGPGADGETVLLA